jgi:SAM-dependent methyltransferase
MEPVDWSLGCRLPDEEWLWVNKEGAFSDESLRRYVAPFPPLELMTSVSGVKSEQDFAAHGAHFYAALTSAAGRKLAEFPSLLDFGCGVGRLMRMLKGHPGNVHGCDIDPRHVAWMSSAIDFCETRLSRVHPPLPYAEATFDALISISVFSHLNEDSQHEFLAELARVTKPGATLMLTIHGDAALRRARTEQRIFDMISVDPAAFAAAGELYDAGQYAFILQHGHLTRLAGDVNSPSILPDSYAYGITFIPKPYIRQHWSRHFKVREIVDGGLHGFQDIVVLER